MYTDAVLIPLVMGLVAMIRKEFPKVDGLKLVLPLTVVLGELVSYAADASGGLRAVAVHGLWLSFGALGLASGAGYVASKVGGSAPAVAVAVAAPAEPAKPTERGGA